MKQIHLRISTSYQYNNQSIFSELIACEQRLLNLKQDNYFVNLPFPKYNNMLDILNYIEENPPFPSIENYIEKSFSVPNKAYNTFKMIAEKTTNTKQPKDYLNKLLEKYNQVTLSQDYRDMSKKSYDKLYFLNDNTLRRFLLTEEFSTEFLLQALKNLKSDNKENRFAFVFSNIMKLFLRCMNQNAIIDDRMYEKFCTMFNINKLENEIDFIEKIIFIRDKISVPGHDGKLCSFKIHHNKINKIKAKENKKIHEKYNSDPNDYVRNEIAPYYREDFWQFLEYDNIRMINFRNRLSLGENDFSKYSNFISKFLLNNSKYSLINIGTESYAILNPEYHDIEFTDDVY